MRRSILLSEPAVALAGQVNTWRFSYTTAQALPAKTLVKFDVNSKGTESDWQLPEVGAKAKSNAIWLELPSKKVIQGSLVQGSMDQFEFTLNEAIEAGEAFTICLGTPHDDKRESQGTRAQTFLERRRSFPIYIDPKGKGDYKDGEAFVLDIKGNELHNIVMITPSLVAKNYRFDIVVRFEDRYGNLTGRVEEGTLIELYYEQLRETLKWTLFCPETGFIALPNIYFNEPGLYILKLKNLKTGELFTSTPIMCSLDEGNMLFWGELHDESTRFNSGEQIESSLRYFRDDRSLQFYSTSSFEDEEETPSDIWKLVNTCVTEFNEEDRFVTIVGMQWFSDAADEGCRQFIFAKDNRPILRKKETKWNSLKKIYKAHAVKEMISIPSITALKGYGYNFDSFAPEYERVVEIYNSFGSSENLAKEGNERPFALSKKKTNLEQSEGTVIQALNNGCRFGFVAGGFDGRAVFKDLIEKDLTTYSKGLTAILSPVHDRESLFQALYNRHCYATTGERILLAFNIAGKPMGSEISTATKPGLCYTRFISGYVAGTSEIEKITIYRNGKEFKTLDHPKSFVEFSLEDSDHYEKHLLSPREDTGHPFLYYYLKVIQKNGHIAWSSPIWIDFPKDERADTLKKAKKKTV